MLKLLPRSGLWRWVVGVFVIALVIVAAYFIFTSRTEAQSTQQPIAFNHQVMVGMGIGCLYCHSDARRSPTAGMPSVQLCMGCHKVIDPQNPEIVKLAAYWQKGEPIPWQRVNVLPRFVYFSHEVHVSVAGINCEKCHGDVAHMTVDKPVVQMNMGWCLGCHEKQPNAAQLTDCVVCHQ
jgi:c(7)-type cytochrome triheme protein